MDPLFTPFALGSHTLANRIVIPPMCQYSAKDGKAGDWHRMHWGSLGVSGAGLLLVEATSVLPEGRISPEDLGLWSDETEEALRRVLESIRPFIQVPMGIQLAHAGRKASCWAPWKEAGQISAAEGGWRPVAPSALPFAEGDCEPSVLDGQGIRQVIEAFTQAALRARRLDFKVVELHAAHGYLLHEFLSPLSNQRTDAYGGSLENRMRLVLETFESMRGVLPDQALGVRISAMDWVEGGWDLEQSVLLAKALKTRGCDYIHVSGGGLSPHQKIRLGPGYQVGLAARIKAETGLPTISVGLITEPQQAAAIVATGEADLVAVGRAMLYDPRWPWHAAAALESQVDAPPQYWRSQPQGVKDLFRVP